MVPWADLGSVVVVGLLLGAGVVALYALGVRVISPADGSDGETLPTVSAGARAFAVLCFAICAAAVAYGLYTLLWPCSHPRRRFTRCTSGIRRRGHSGGALLSSDNQSARTAMEEHVIFLVLTALLLFGAAAWTVLNQSTARRGSGRARAGTVLLALSAAFAMAGTLYGLTHL
jgi:hypothetical protein